LKKLDAPILAAAAIMASTCAFAEPADYVSQPAVEYGEREIDFKLGSASKGADPRESAASIGFGYGATAWWFTELYVKYKREDGNGTNFDAVEWENKFQLTETGKYPVDVGLLLEIERPQDHAEGWEVKWGPLFQTEFGKIQLNFNPLLQRNYRGEGFAQTEFKYQWQAKYRWRRELEFGLQGFGETGKWNDWAPREEQNHRMGPAVFGKLPLGGRRALEYNAAWLFGASQAAPNHTFRLQVELEY
jgi:hypothetical protein